VLRGFITPGRGSAPHGRPGALTAAPGSREPSCFDLLALAQLPLEQQPPERARLCAFYAGSCRDPQGRAACARLAEETCRARTRRCGESCQGKGIGRDPVSGSVGPVWCQGYGSAAAPAELHSYAQTLVDLLRRAGDFIRNQFDFSFLTRALPQLLGKIYGQLFPPRVRRDAPGTLPCWASRCPLGIPSVPPMPVAPAACPGIPMGLPYPLSLLSSSCPHRPSCGRGPAQPHSRATPETPLQVRRGGTREGLKDLGRWARCLWALTGCFGDSVN